MHKQKELRHHFVFLMNTGVRRDENYQLIKLSQYIDRDIDNSIKHL